MLKRSRAPSPSPTRADLSSPPPLGDNPRLPFPKRRRTAGPIIDSVERSAGVTHEDDGEDDDDFDYEDNGTGKLPPGDKAYEHMNHILHCLHAEHQHRSRSVQPRSVPYLTGQNSQTRGAPTFISPHDSPPSCSSPSSSPANYYRESQACSSSMSTRHRVLPLEAEAEETVSELSDSVHGIIPSKTEHGEDERMRVMQRYEDTNMLLGSLILSRRRTLR